MGIGAIYKAARNVKFFADTLPICSIHNDIRTYIPDIQRYPLSYGHKNMHRKCCILCKYITIVRYYFK